MLVNYKIEYFNKAHTEYLFDIQFIEKNNWRGGGANEKKFERNW